MPMFKTWIPYHCLEGSREDVSSVRAVGASGASGIAHRRMRDGYPEKIDDRLCVQGSEAAATGTLSAG